MNTLDLSIISLHKQYRDGSLSPAKVVDYVLEKCRRYQDYHIWITLMSKDQIAPYLGGITDGSPDTLPLYGVPFAIKDNIDLIDVPTTAACPEFSHTPTQSAFVVQRLIDAGAIPIGKTNLDQFATGLTGTRSPFGAVKNSINPEYISGGSSSGSAVATALGLVSFALGTDTAGSGRVPAMFNNLIGVKPSCGVVSTRGVVPACRSLDCVSLFALNPDDAARIYSIMAVYDEKDSYARKPEWIPEPDKIHFKFGIVPREQMQASGNPQVPRLMDEMTNKLISLGGQPVEIDFTPFQQTARLLYEGPWIAERYATIEKLFMTRPTALLPITRTIISEADNFNAVDTFRAMYKLRELKRMTDREMSKVDLVLTPTAANIYSLRELEEDPIGLNTRLGYYTNFMNLLDYPAIAVPAGRFENGLPFGVTLFADKFSDNYLVRLSRHVLAMSEYVMGATNFTWTPDNTITAEIDDERTNLLVCGAHLTGMPLNHQLLDLNAVLVQTTTTSDHYRLYSLPGGPPYRPGLVKVQDNGCHIDVEIWSIPISNLGRFIQGIPAPLGLGKVELRDGNEVIGFICESYVIGSALDITRHGGWINYIREQTNK